MNAPVQGRLWIERLCIATAHEWSPERLYVIYTAHFDETDTHGPAPTVILSAFVGHAYQWRRFETKLARIQKEHGFSIFHAKEFKARKGEFAGWSDEKCSRVIHQLTELVAENLTEGVSIHLERERYLTEYRSPPVPRKMNLDSQYGVCFRGCLGRLLQILEERGNRDVLNVVMEAGHKNAGDCQRIFFDLKRRFDSLGHKLLGDFTLATKRDCPPLMVADMLASAHSMMRDGLETGELDPAQLPLSPVKTPRRGRLAFLELDVEALRDLKAGFEALRRLEIEQWREARAARALASLGQRS